MAAAGVSGALVVVSPRRSSLMPGEDCQTSSVSLVLGQNCEAFVQSGEFRRRRRRSRSGATSSSWAYATDANHTRENFESRHIISGQTLYDYLGVSQLSTPEQIRTAYRSKALKVHPDVVPEDQRDDATKAFLELKMAYMILHDRQQRAAYDLKLRFCDRGPMSIAPSHQWGFISVPSSPDDPSGTITFRGRKHYESDLFS